MAHDVFISHSAKNKIAGDAVCAKLESEGIRCWIAPRDVTPGMEWGECIIDAIEQARIMVLVFSSHANDSPQIRREVERAVNHGVAILPLRIEEVVPTKALEYFIGSVHWLDALTPPLDAHLKNLAGTVKLLLGRMQPREEEPVVQLLRHAAAVLPDATQPAPLPSEAERAEPKPETQAPPLAAQSATSAATREPEAPIPPSAPELEEAAAEPRRAEPAVAALPAAEAFKVDAGDRTGAAEETGTRQEETRSSPAAALDGGPYPLTESLAEPLANPGEGLFMSSYAERDYGDAGDSRPILQKVPGWPWYLAILVALVLVLVFVSTQWGTNSTPAGPPPEASFPAGGGGGAPSPEPTSPAMPRPVQTVAQRGPAGSAPQAPPNAGGVSGRRPEETGSQPVQPSSGPGSTTPATPQELAEEARALFAQERYTEAKPLAERACNGGSANGCGILALIYYDSQDYARAAPLYQRACDGGDAKGCYALGRMYESVYASGGSQAQVRSLFQRACDGGYPQPCLDLGSEYEIGLGVSKDYPRAASLYRRACDGGSDVG
jgi:hypothetical protein